MKLTWNIIDLDNQFIYINKHGKVEIIVGIAIPDIKSDMVYTFDAIDEVDNFYDDDYTEWYYNNKLKKWTSGIGINNERFPPEEYNDLRK